MKNGQENSIQSHQQPQKPRLMYSEAMAKLQAAFASKNLLIREQSPDALKTKDDNTISVTFLKRSTIKKQA